MPRSPTGDFTLPLPPVISGDTIEADWANTTLADMAQALTDSLSRTAQGSMSSPLKIVDGSKAAPGIAFVNEANTGFYRPAAGDLYVSVLGVDYMRWTDDNGVQISTDGSTWSTVTTAAVLADQEVTAVTWATAPDTLTLVKAKGDLTVVIDTFTDLTVKNDLTVENRVYAAALAVEGPVNQKSVQTTGTSTMVVDSLNANRHRATNNTAGGISLEIAKPTGPVTMAGGPVEEYTVEGTILFTNGATPGLVTIAGAAAEEVLGTNSTIANARYMLTYVIHRLTGDVYSEIYIWSAIP